jgi:adenosylcobinamide-GDP ribazoletransferase
VPGERATRTLPERGLSAGLRLALTTFTVAPVRPAPVDRAAGAAAMACAPLVGALLGAAAGGVALGLRALHAPGLVLGVVVVALDALLTRGMHLDGLADTVDGLGSYASRQRALEIMRSPEVGPFGVAAIALAVLLQAASVAGIAARAGAGLGLLGSIVVASAAGRFAVTIACRRGVPAARPEGLGALVAGTVRWPFVVPGAAGVCLLALVAVPARPWQGPLAVALALLAALLVQSHAVRRLGGVTGDVLGALVQVAVTVTYLVLSLA